MLFESFLLALRAANVATFVYDAYHWYYDYIPVVRKVWGYYGIDAIVAIVCLIMVFKHCTARGRNVCRFAYHYYAARHFPKAARAEVLQRLAVSASAVSLAHTQFFACTVALQAVVLILDSNSAFYDLGYICGAFACFTWGFTSALVEFLYKFVYEFFRLLFTRPTALFTRGDLIALAAGCSFWAFAVHVSTGPQRQ
ncbi:hypothetical protein EV121DRAFT_292372 [Schizophyllum commune]